MIELEPFLPIIGEWMDKGGESVEKVADPPPPPPHQVICGDVIDVLEGMSAGTVHAVITSPPYYGLRDYGIPGRIWDDNQKCEHVWGQPLPCHHPGQVEQTKWKNADAAGKGQTASSGQYCDRGCGAWKGALGLEPNLDLYIAHLVDVFRAVKRVLHPRGSLWLNLGDCYAGGGKHVEPVKYAPADGGKPVRAKASGMSGKNLLMVPARAALALQADGWILRQDNIWAKGLSFCPTYSGSVMPESTRDRTTWAHEHVFQLTLREDAFYDIEAGREPYADSTLRSAREGYRGEGRKDYDGAGVQNPSEVKRRVLASVGASEGRNLRNVWVIPKQPFPGAHFATFPEALVEPIIKLATSERGACAACGEQWRRRVVREEVPKAVQDAFESARQASADRTGRTDGHTQRRPNFRRRVLREEWEAGCECAVGEPIPALVCDIFAGSGRTGIVSKRLGRRFVGIDVNQAYVEMANAAIQAVEEKK